MKKKLLTLLTLALCVCSGAWAEETIYSMTAVTGPTGNQASKATVDITATFVGGSAQAYNGKGSEAKLVDGSNINLGGSSESYFHATLTDGTIAEGDIIALSASGAMRISATQANATSKNATEVTFPYTVPSGSELIGKTDVYVLKKDVSKFSSFTITRPDADDVANPVISQSGSSVTITCGTAGANIYYTIDGSEPTASSTSYSAAITIDNPCTVRAIAIKGENSSSIVIKDCYVSHSSALTVLGYKGGTVSGDVWTSNDGQYILTNNVAGRGIGYVNLAGSQDGFKLNHTDSYTLKISDNVKVTKIVVVGKSWLKGSAGNAATLAFDGFTPASVSFFDYVDKTYVNTFEFTPETALGYGATITMRPGSNQLGAYIEIYGEEYTKNTSTFAAPVTWDFTNWSAATKAGVLADNTNWNQTENESGGNDFKENLGRAYKNALASAELQYDGNAIAETEGLKFTANAYGMAVLFDFDHTDIGTYQGGSYIWLYGKTSTITIPNVPAGSTIEIGVESHKASEARGVTLNNCTQTQGEATAKAYQVCKWTVNTTGDITITPSKGLHIYYITLTKAEPAVAFTPANAKSTYVTTKALDFSDVDGLKAYAATAASAGKVTLTEVGAVPAGTPLMLIGTAGTEYTVPVATSASAPAKNLFKAGDGTTVFDGSTYDYILFTDGLFHPIASGTVATTKAYLHCDSDPTAAGARSLAITFDDDVTTGVTEIVNSKLSNSKYFDLQGRRVAAPQKGLYIVNGKKVVLK